MLQLSLGNRHFGNITIRHPSLRGSVIRVEHLSRAQEGEGGRKRTEKSEQSKWAEFVVEKQLLFENYKEREMA